MKDLNLKNHVQEVDLNSQDKSSTNHLEFNEVMVYQEMSDQTAIRLNLIEQIHEQMNQLDEMICRKQYLIKEVFNEIMK